MRKLPIYLVLDVSGSMSGEPIEQVKEGLQMLVASLRQDPYALETAWISVITFASKVEQPVPLTELTSFQPPILSPSGATALGEALRFTAACAAREVRKASPDTKGDWKPMVFLMSDGRPTDDWKKGLANFRKQSWGITIGCAVNKADPKVLKEVCGNAVVQLSTSNPASMAALFKWVSASISTSSQKIESSGKEVQGLDELPPPPPEINVVV